MGNAIELLLCKVRRRPESKFERVTCVVPNQREQKLQGKYTNTFVFEKSRNNGKIRETRTKTNNS